MLNCGLVFTLIAVGALFAEACLAGLYLVAGPNWNNFVFEPVEREETSNYYGYGARGSFGYSLGQILDLGLYGHYTPGRLDSASLTKEDARLWHAGAEAGLRFANAVFLGVRGGPALYRLNVKNEDSEVEGQWTGTMFQGSLGLIMPVTKTSFWQTTVDIGQATLKSSGAETVTKPRTLTQISLTLAFVYNVQQTSAVDKAILNHWIRGF